VINGGIIPSPLFLLWVASDGIRWYVLSSCRDDMHRPLSIPRTPWDNFFPFSFPLSFFRSLSSITRGCWADDGWKLEDRGLFFLPPFSSPPLRFSATSRCVTRTLPSGRLTQSTSSPCASLSSPPFFFFPIVASRYDMISKARGPFGALKRRFTKVGDLPFPSPFSFSLPCCAPNAKVTRVKVIVAL